MHNFSRCICLSKLSILNRYEPSLWLATLRFLRRLQTFEEVISPPDFILDITILLMRVNS